MHTNYRITIEGHLDLNWSDWFDNMTISYDEQGNTVLTGPVIDQPALHGILDRIQNLNLTLISVTQFIAENEEHLLLTSEEKDMHTQQQDSQRTKRNLIIFVSLIVAIGWLAAGLEALMDDPSAEGMGMGLWIISPLAISILLRIFAGDGWRDLGIHPRLGTNAQWYGVSALIYVISTALVLGIGVIIGATDLIGDGVGGFISVFVAAFVSLFIKNIFEEFGWRGYLAPKVHTLGWNTFAAHGFVGLVWAAWHMPYYLVLLDTTDFESYTSQSMIAFIPLVFLGLMVASIAYGEIHLLTGSVWPAVLMHAVGNAFTTALIQEDYIEMESNLEFLVTPGPEGVLSIIFITLVGIQLYRLRKKQTLTA